MPALTNIPVTATIGPGAWVDVSAVSAILTVLNAFAASDDNIILEQSFDAGVTSAGPVGNFPSGNGPSSQILQVDGNRLRANRIAGSGGAYNIHVSGQNQVGVGALQTINVPGAPGPTAAIDISAQPSQLQLTINQGAVSGDLVRVEHSLDAINFVPLGLVAQGQILLVTSGAIKLRANRIFGGAALVLQVQGIPTGK